MKRSWTSSRSEPFMPAWYEAARRSRAHSVSASSSAWRRVAT